MSFVLYFFYGTDAFRIKEALDEEIRRGREALGIPAEAPVFRISPDDEEPLRIFEFLNARSLFERGRIAIVERIGEFPKTLAQELAQRLKEGRYAEEPEVLVHITHLTSEKTKDRAKDPITLLLAKKPVLAKEFAVLEGEKLEAWIQQKAVGRGVLLDRSAVAALESAHGNDLRIIAQEIEKLALYLGADPKTSQKAGARELALLGWERVAQDGFRLIDAMGKKAHGEMLRILLRLFGMGEDPIKILGLLVYGVRAMLAVKEAQSRPMNPSDIPKLVGLADWQVRQYRNASGKFSLDDLKKMYERLLTADYKIKTGEGDSRLLLERFLLSV